MFKLRDYQKDTISQIYQHFRGGKRRCLTFAPTGAGKSLLIAGIVRDALLKGRRVLIVVHRQKLAHQLAGTISALCGHHPSIIAPRQKTDYSNPVQIAMAQTLARRELPPDINILLGDEIHCVGFFDIWHKCLDAYCGGIWALSKAFVVGFTATPWRMNDKQGFCHLFDCVASAPSPRKLIEMGYLTNPRLFAYKVLDTEGLEIGEDGDYTVSSLSRACNEEYNLDVVAKWAELCPGRKTIAFCANIAQAKNLCRIFLERGFSAELVTGSTNEKEREAIFLRFKGGKTQILVSVGTVTEGYDETSIEAVLIARLTRSPALLMQMAGRGLRLHEGKEDVYLIDCGDCFDWLMSTKIKGAWVKDPIDLSHVPLCPVRRAVTVKADTKICLGCGESIPIFTRVCPHCNAEIPLNKKVVPNIIDFPDLEEIFTPIARKQYHFIRTEIKRCFEQGRNPQGIYKKFHSLFGILPPKDYFLGAIFDLESNEIEESAYHHFLSQFKIHSQIVDMFVDLEFGTVGRDYKLSAGTYSRAKKRYNRSLPFNPWNYLGVPSYASFEEIKLAYTNKLAECLPPSSECKPPLEGRAVSFSIKEMRSRINIFKILLMAERK